MIDLPKGGRAGGALEFSCEGVVFLVTNAWRSPWRNLLRTHRRERGCNKYYNGKQQHTSKL